jgi:hypothetical protein
MWWLDAEWALTSSENNIRATDERCAEARSQFRGDGVDPVITSSKQETWYHRGPSVVAVFVLAMRWSFDSESSP